MMRRQLVSSLILKQKVTMGEPGLVVSTFGKEFDCVWPKVSSELLELTEFTKHLLEQCKQVVKPKNDVSIADFNQLCEDSENFACTFPIDSCRIKAQPKERRYAISKQAGTAYPIIHERTLYLYLNFLEHKKKFGTEKEISVYNNMTLTEFVQRLLTKRCVYFYMSTDYYKLLNGKQGSGGFEKIGTMNEQCPLLLKDVLSYDEIKLSALLYISCHSEFINDGNRNNAGRVEDKKSLIEPHGVIMGLIGARFERPYVMEYQDIIISQSQNTNKNGYGSASDSNTCAGNYRRLWRNFYEGKDFSYAEAVVDKQRFEYMDMDATKSKFDNVAMKKRYAITFDTLLLESEARAVAAGKPAYIHVVGIGLGVWEVAEQQEKIFLETFEQRMRALGERLMHIECVHFAWFHIPEWHGLRHGERVHVVNHPKGGIMVRVSRRNPAEKLPEDALLIVTYAWDGNALPGNEFWHGSLEGSGDPAAACSTLITELQNPHINKTYVNGQNLHIASLEHGVLHIENYANQMLP